MIQYTYKSTYFIHTQKKSIFFAWHSVLSSLELKTVIAHTAAAAVVVVVVGVSFISIDKTRKKIDEIELIGVKLSRMNTDGCDVATCKSQYTDRMAYAKRWNTALECIPTCSW